MISTQESDPELIYCFRGFHEKVVKLFLKFISRFSRRAVDRASIRTRYVGPCFDPLFAAKGGTLLSQCRSLMLSFRRENATVPNRPSSVAVLSWVESSPERLPRRAVRGLGAHSPNQTGSSRGVEGFIRFTGFPEREEQYGELSCDSDDGPLLGLGCPLAPCRSPGTPDHNNRMTCASIALVVWLFIIPFALGMLALEELRKWIVRACPNRPTTTDPI